jgi:hypothetical protein
LAKDPAEYKHKPPNSGWNRPVLAVVGLDDGGAVADRHAEALVAFEDPHLSFTIQPWA